jgi:hypothetical protein
MGHEALTVGAAVIVSSMQRHDGQPIAIRGAGTPTWGMIGCRWPELRNHRRGRAGW